MTGTKKEAKFSLGKLIKNHHRSTLCDKLATKKEEIGQLLDLF